MKFTYTLFLLLACASPTLAEDTNLIVLPDSSSTPPVLAENRDWQAFIDGASDNMGMKSRAGEAMRSLDERVGQVLGEVNSEIDEQASTLLMGNQRAWEQQIRTKCSFLADTYRGGTHAGLAYNYCVIQEQIARITELRKMQEYRQSP